GAGGSPPSRRAAPPRRSPLRRACAVSWSFPLGREHPRSVLGVPPAIGNPRVQFLVDVVGTPGIRERLAEDVLRLPSEHHVLVLHPLGGGDGEPRPAHSIEVIAWIGPHHALGEVRYPLGRVR